MACCSVCQHSILSPAKSVKCWVCGNLTHVHCLSDVFDILIVDSQNDWICLLCSDNVFPFNHSADDDIFSSDFNDVFGVRSIPELEDINFNPFDTNDINESLPLLEVDPDLQFFNDVANFQNYTGNCRYFIEDTFNTYAVDHNFSNNCFSIFHLNIRSLPKHHNEFSCYLENFKVNFNVIGLTETWLKLENCDLYQLDGYNHINQCRNGRSGGGVSLFINEQWTYFKRCDLGLNYDNAECLFVEISKSVTSFSKNLIIGIVYRPPNTDIFDFNSKFLEILNKVRNENKLVYIMGDFNVNLLNADTHNPSAEFLEMFYANGFLPLITKPTRIQNTATLIDNIFCNQLLDYDIVSGILYTDISDHLPLFTFCKDKLTEDVNTTYESRDFAYKNIVKFQNMLSGFDWQLILKCHDCKKAFSILHDNYRDMFDKCFPLKISNRIYKSRKEWLTPALKSSIKVKNKLYLTYKRCPSIYNQARYRAYRNQLTSTLRQAEKIHFENLFEKYKSNIKKSWGLLKHIIGRNKSSLNKQFLINDQLTSDRKTIAESFNKFFVNIGPNLNREIQTSGVDPLHYMNKTTSYNSLFLRDTDREEVKRIIKELKDGASGYDGISAKLIKNTYHIFINPLIHIINLSLSQGIFPQELKIAKVIPIYKSGETTLIKNYRPVSVLSVFSKIFERIIHVRLLDFLDQHNILSNSQFGFRKKHSTVSALSILIDKIYTGLNDGNITLGLYLDFSKAFDTIDHQILFKKLFHYGIRGIALDLLKDYFLNRKQFVCFDNNNSPLLNTSCGVPQGSILGPLLFILYINDISNVSTKLFPIIYADDSNLFIQGKNITDMVAVLNTEVKKVSEWVNSNKLSLNISKTNYMVFKRKNYRVHVPDDIIINNNIISRVYTIKFLGVILDSHLTWEKHINYIRNKISKSIGIINKVKRLINRSTFITMYYSFIYPYLSYAIELWGNSSKYNLDALFRQQKKIIRMICNAPYLAHSLPLFTDLKILNVFQLYQYQLGLFMFKIHNNCCPTAVRSMLSEYVFDHEYKTRSKSQSKFKIPFYKLSICQKNIKYKIITFWNYITDKINTNCSDKNFKRQLKLYILQHQISF